MTCLNYNLKVYGNRQQKHQVNELAAPRQLHQIKYKCNDIPLPYSKILPIQTTETTVIKIEMSQTNK